LGLIEKIRILEDQIRSKNARKLKISSKLEVELKKFTADDLYEKGAKLQGFNSVEDKGEVEKLKV